MKEIDLLSDIIRTKELKNSLFGLVVGTR